ncbi:MAG: RNA polymerase sigma factor RpoE [gamma proteobacterium symbiont of Bathyaustriella thionipta]|nr:RNA polymerase sigma factor RpoE [gamma proteobacterium symbiont of Bathyaustriella thionipta]
MNDKALDQQLVVRVQQGDKSAYDLLVRKYQNRVVSLIRRYVRNPMDAEDVAQEAFIKAYRALANFRGDSAFYTWLYRIAINTAKNWLVSQGRRPPLADVDYADAESMDESGRFSENASPERMALQAEIVDNIQQVVDHLPQDLRTAITLREAEGFSYEDIAEAMDCPVGTVRSRIFRARDAIDKKLKPLLEQ